MNLDLLSILGFLLLLIVCVFVVIMTIMARIGGWSALAEVYRCQDKFHGRRWSGQDISLRSRWLGYSGCVTVGADAKGLYLSVFFRIAHPPLFIPWTDLAPTHEHMRILFWKMGLVRFTCTQVPRIPFWLRAKLMAKIAAELGPEWSATSPTPREAMYD